MIRERTMFQKVVSYIADICVVFLSYVVSIYFRYEIMISQPGVNALSLPYLLIAGAYSIIISSVLYYIRSSSVQRKYGLLAINAVGCLALFAFFYVIGELYFSRWALVIFWIVSSFLLAIKSMVMRIIFDKQSARATKRIRVLVVGEGKVTFEFICSANWDSACSFNLVGYVGNKSVNFFDCEFSGKGTDPEYEGWLGNYDDFEKVLDKEHPDEVVFALDDSELHRLDYLNQIVERKGIRSSLAMSFSKNIPENAKIQKLDEMTLIDMGKDEVRHYSSIKVLGLVVSSVLMVLMLFIRNFNVGSIQSYGIFDEMKCYMFAVIGFLVFREVCEKLKNKKAAEIIGTVITVLTMLFIVVGYESLYLHGVGIGKAVLIDMKMVVCVLGISLMTVLLGNALGNIDWWLMD